jgi:hypothetical protein
VPLHREHSELCKFAAPNDLGYLEISGRIRSLAEDAAAAASAEFDATRLAGMFQR